MEQEKLVVRDTTVDKAISKGLAQLNLGSHDVDINIVSEGKRGLFGFGQKEAVVEITPKQIPELREPGNIAVYENEERAEYISENMDEENLDSEADAYDTTDTVAARTFDEEDRDRKAPGTLVDVEYAEGVEEDLEEDLYDNEEEEEDWEDSEADEEARNVSRQEAIKQTIDYLTSVSETYGAPAAVRVEEKGNMIIFHMDSDKPGLLIGKHGKIINALQTLGQTIFQHNQQRRVTVIVNVGDYRERRTRILENIADRTAERVLRTKQPVFLEPLPAFERKQIHARLSTNNRIVTHSEGKEPHRYLVVEIAK